MGDVMPKQKDSVYDGGKVVYHKIPVWLDRLLKPKVKEMGLYSVEELLTFRRKWVDHWGKAITPRGEVFVCEPYSLHDESMWSILGFCDEYGLRCHVDPKSSHYPGSTIRLEFYPRSGNLI